MTRKLVSKKELKSVCGVPYSCITKHGLTATDQRVAPGAVFNNDALVPFVLKLLRNDAKQNVRRTAG